MPDPEDDIDLLKGALERMTKAFQPFTSRPIGGPGSIARMEQDEQRDAHAHALKILREVR